MTYIKVKDKNNLYRDSHSNGIVNEDRKAYEQYLNSYTQKINENKKIENLSNEVASLHQDLNEIKTLLRVLLNESKWNWIKYY